MKVKVEGLRELETALAGLGKSTGKAVLRRVLKAAAEPMVDTARSRAPSRPSGAKPVYYGKGNNRRLRRSGTDQSLVQSGAKLTRNQARLAKKEGKDAAEHYVGSRDPIARLLEFGTSDTPTQPIFRAAWDQHKEHSLEIVKTQLAVEIDRAAKRAERKAAKSAKG